MTKYTSSYFSGIVDLPLRRGTPRLLLAAASCHESEEHIRRSFQQLGRISRHSAGSRSGRRC